MGITSENVAEQYNVGREEQDEFVRHTPLCNALLHYCTVLPPFLFVSRRHSFVQLPGVFCYTLSRPVALCNNAHLTHAVNTARRPHRSSFALGFGTKLAPRAAIDKRRSTGWAQACESHRRAAAARSGGLFAEEIIPTQAIQKDEDGTRMTGYDTPCTTLHCALYIVPCALCLVFVRD